MENEIWKSVLGYEDCYEVSNLGRVRSLPRIHAGNLGNRIYGGRILDPHHKDKRKKYLFVSLSKNGVSKQYRVHRLVLMAFKGPPPAGHEGCHNNSNPNDNRLSNLRWDTGKNNLADRNLNNTAPRGENCGTAKLTWEKVRKIRISDKNRYELAAEYNVTYTCIAYILRGDSWKE